MLTHLSLFSGVGGLDLSAKPSTGRMYRNGVIFIGRYKHGDSRHGRGSNKRLYRIWENMRRRCNNPKAHGYKYYGGRGIAVCDEWNDYLNFKTWAFENGYKDNLTIDRINSDGNYTPDNCRWSSYLEQANNMRSNTNIEYHGEIYSLSEWARRLNMPRKTIYNRIFVYGWPIEKAFTAQRYPSSATP